MISKNKLIAYYLMKRKTRRRYWVHPIYEDRKEKGAFALLFVQLLEDEEKFVNYFRMDIRCFNLLVEKIKPHLIKIKKQ